MRDHASDNVEVQAPHVRIHDSPKHVANANAAVADDFLSDKPIVETKKRDSINDPISSGVETLYDGPMVTLVNEGTASASEILAGALQDNQRSELIGTKTFGKGLIQSLTNLSDGSGLDLVNYSHSVVQIPKISTAEQKSTICGV